MKSFDIRKDVHTIMDGARYVLTVDGEDTNLSYLTIIEQYTFSASVKIYWGGDMIKYIDYISFINYGDFVLETCKELYYIYNRDNIIDDIEKK